MQLFAAIVALCALVGPVSRAAPPATIVVDLDLSAVASKTLTPAEQKILEDIQNGRPVDFQALTQAWMDKYRRSYAERTKAPLNTADLLAAVKAVLPEDPSEEPLALRTQIENALSTRHEGKELLYNRDFSNPVDLLLKNRMQCLAGTICHTWLLREAWGAEKYTARKPVVIFESGHVLLGFVEQRAGGAYLVGLETTTTEEKFREFGKVSDLAKSLNVVRVVDANLYAAFDLYAPHLDAPNRRRLVTDILRKTALQHRIDLASTEKKVQLQLAGKAGSNDQSLAFGDPAAPVGDQKRSNVAPTGGTRVVAVPPLGRLDDRVANAVAQLLTREKEATWVQYAAIQSLADMGEAGLPVLRSQLKRTSAYDAAVVLAAIARADRSKKESISLLLEALFGKGLGEPPAPNEYQLASNFASAQEAVAKALGTLGPLPKEVLEQLQATLKDDSSPRKQSLVLQVLQGVGPSAKALGPSVAALVSSKDSTLGSTALTTLAQIEGDTAPAIVLGIESPSAFTQATAMHLLASSGPRGVESLLQLAKDGKVPWSQVPRALGASGAAGVSHLVKMLENAVLAPQPEEDAKRVVGAQSVIEALGELGPVAKSAVPALQKIASGERSERRGAALIALCKIDPSAIPALLPQVFEHLRADNYLLAHALPTEGVIAPLLELALDPKNEKLAPYFAWNVLWNRKPKGESLWKLLAPRWDKMDKGQRNEAFRVLLRGWSGDWVQRPETIEFLESHAVKQRGVDADGTAAFARLATVKEAPSVLELLENENEFVRAYAVGIVSAMGAKADGGTDRVKRCLRDKSPVVRHAAVEGVITLDVPRSEVDATLMDLLSDESSEVRAGAAKALGRLRVGPLR